MPMPNNTNPSAAKSSARRVANNCTAPQHNNAKLRKCSALSLLDGSSGNSGGGPMHTAISTTIAAIHKPTHNRGR